MTTEKSLGSQTTANPVPRIPPAHGGFQYNACKNPKCPNFGVPAPEKATKGVTGPYALSSAGKGYPLLRCNLCGEAPPLKSNIGIREEIERISAYLSEEPPAHCPNDRPDPATGRVCPNHAGKVPYGTKGAYRAHGTNAHGSKRALCTGCGKTFVVESRPDKGQHDTHSNREVFSLLMNKMPLSRIVKHLGISWETLYNRIDFIHSQSMAFASRRERRLKTMPIRRLYLSVDAQDYHVNWTRRDDKRNVVLKALTVADGTTGYVFCNALNFDEKADRARIEDEARANGDNMLPPAKRRHARYWLARDYMESVEETARRGKAPVPDTLLGKVSKAYAEAAARGDVETFDEKIRDERLPEKGMQIHSEYSMTLAASRAGRSLTLDCVWSEPSIDEGRMLWTPREGRCRFTDLTLDTERQRAFLFDADSSRARCEALLVDQPLRDAFRRYWFAEHREHAEWLRLRGEFGKKGIKLPEYLFEADNLRPLLATLYSAEAGRPCGGWDFPNLVVLAHHVHKIYKGHLWAFRLMLLAHDRVAVMREHDTTKKWAAKATGYKDSWRDGKTEFAPDRRHDRLVCLLFPEIADRLPMDPC